MNKAHIKFFLLAGLGLSACGGHPVENLAESVADATTAVVETTGNAVKTVGEAGATVLTKTAETAGDVGSAVAKTADTAVKAVTPEQSAITELANEALSPENQIKRLYEQLENSNKTVHLLQEKNNLLNEKSTDLERKLQEQNETLQALQAELNRLQSQIPEKTKDFKSESFSLSGDGLFAFNQTDLQENSAKIIEELVEKISQFKKLNRIHISGHTDRLGDFKRNLMLSEQRAKTVKKALVKAGIPEKIIVTKGYGEIMPIKHCAEELPKPEAIVCLEPNRRVEILINGIK